MIATRNSILFKDELKKPSHFVKAFLFPELLKRREEFMQPL